jgi:tRNA U38,U39,U40 pseudouridine synthase TruA
VVLSRHNVVCDVMLHAFSFVATVIRMLVTVNMVMSQRLYPTQICSDFQPFQINSFKNATKTLLTLSAVIGGGLIAYGSVGM